MSEQKILKQIEKLRNKISRLEEKLLTANAIDAEAFEVQVKYLNDQIQELETGYELERQRQEYRQFCEREQKRIDDILKINDEIMQNYERMVTQRLSRRSSSRRKSGKSFGSLFGSSNTNYNENYSNFDDDFDEDYDNDNDYSSDGGDGGDGGGGD